MICDSARSRPSRRALTASMFGIGIRPPTSRSGTCHVRFAFSTKKLHDLLRTALTIRKCSRIMFAMNKLPLAKRVQVLSMLCEGSSMRSISRVADVSYPAIDRLLREAGAACVEFHDRAVRGVKSRRVQCDEIWSFVHAKQKNVATAKAAPEGAGDIW